MNSNESCNNSQYKKRYGNSDIEAENFSNNPTTSSNKDKKHDKDTKSFGIRQNHTDMYGNKDNMPTTVGSQKDLQTKILGPNVLSNIVNPLKNSNLYLGNTGDIADQLQNNPNFKKDLMDLNEQKDKSDKNIRKLNFDASRILGKKFDVANKDYFPKGAVVQDDSNHTIHINSGKLYNPDPNMIPQLQLNLDQDMSAMYNPNPADNMKNVYGVIDSNLFDTGALGLGVKHFTEETESEFKYAPISKFSGIPTDKDFDPESLLIDSSNFLCAPICNNLYYTNSIANTNKNASQDIRGDICIKYNANFTPFYQSAIYGEPLTINRLGDCPVKVPSCLL